jgi:hypothetical protein
MRWEHQASPSNYIVEFISLVLLIQDRIILFFRSLYYCQNQTKFGKYKNISICIGHSERSLQYAPTDAEWTSFLTSTLIRQPPTLKFVIILHTPKTRELLN